MENILFLLQMNEQKTKLLAELKFKTARAGGKGGQHVNKVSSKVMLIWPLAESACFNAEQKELLQSRLENRINKAGEFFWKHLPIEVSWPIRKLLSPAFLNCWNTP